MPDGASAERRPPLRVGLVGTGFMGKCHALAWNAVAPTFGDVSRPILAVLADVDADLAARKAAELGFAQSTADWRTLVADPGVDIVSIAAPNHLHAEVAIAALEAGKHVWCEKPMAPTLADGERMAAAARASGRVAVLGYNYVQSPALRLMRKILREGSIGAVTHVRIEMDEDFMADPDAPFSWRGERAAGHGALDDFAVHPLSLTAVLLGPVARVFADMAKPYPDRPDGDRRRAVETHDIATLLFRVEDGASGSIAINRAAWGRKNRIFVQIFGARGALVFDQERMNEVSLYVAEGPPETRGFRTIVTGPAHPPFENFNPAPGHGLGFNDLKTIECRELMRAIGGEPALVIDFEQGLRIERAVHAAAQSFDRGAWVDVPA